MSNYGSSNSASRGRLIVESTGRKTTGPTYYNRSSLAVDLDVPAPEQALLPRLVPATAAPGVMVGAPTFMGLDVATARKDPTSKWVSAVIHVVVIAAVLWLGFKAKNTFVPPIKAEPVNITLYAPPPPPKVLPVAPKVGGGGGGGAHQVVEPIKGNPPKIVAPKMVVNAPQVLKVDNPKLAAEPS